MALKFDHAVIAVEDLDGAMADYRALGFTVFRGGVHANRATENALIVFEDGTYLELLAGTREEPIAGLVDFSVLLKNGEGLVGYALGCDDIEAEVTRLRAAGFALGEIIPGERRRGDGTLIQWKLALIEGGFAPFLIEDVTPRELRVTRDPTLTRHANRAVGVRGVEVAVRAMDEAWQRYTRLFGVPVNQRATTYRNAGCVTLRQGNPARMNYFVNTLPDYLRMFAGRVAQNEVDVADPTQEPKGFERQREREAQKLLPLQREAEIERALAALTATQAEALFAIVLVREQAQDYRFALDKTHGVRFQERIGVSKERGRDILIGVDDFD
ncbi:MAG: VOC family protein [Anaerolineae bacterium]